ncbi:MAG TPA: FAD-dependent oxidoreductase [Ignavibacteria bacterium]|nr:FAD-dependent oxidoreductase [Ignavibacteria bacterium]HMQ99465.1 FAD-dependent oxidoreductase [Ignavibacteria bacterium]
MRLPFIIIVDDDEHVLRAIQRDVRNEYREMYRVSATDSANEAIELVNELKQKNETVALFISDQRMPVMDGVTFLGLVKEIFPDAKSILLTAYSDIEVAIKAINDIKLDHYLLKPWNPPEEKLYPALNELLYDWAENVRMPYDGIRLIGSRWSSKSYVVKEYLSRNLIPSQWSDIEADAEMKQLALSITGDINKLPVVLFPDGTNLIMPSNSKIAEKAGLQTSAKLPFYDLIIVGAGPAGLAAAVYAASEGLKTLVVEQNAPGGQAGTSSRIENYLGFPSGISGTELAGRATAQVRRFGAEIMNEEIVSIRIEEPYKILKLCSGKEVSSYAVVFTSGVSVRMLETQGIDKFLGTGVYYGAAMTEAATYKDQDVCILGGANSAGQGALFFSRYAKSVTMIVRAGSLSKAMSNYLVERINSAANIKVLTETEMCALNGSGKLEKITLKNVKDGKVFEKDTSAVFIFIGSAPRTEMMKGLLQTDDKGYILTGPDLVRVNNKLEGWIPERDPFILETNIPGVFAAGDVRAGSGKRVAAAVGEGSASISMVHKYLETV